MTVNLQLPADGRSARAGAVARDRTRRHWELLALTCWTAMWFVILGPRGGIAWHFFVAGSRLLFSGRYGVFYLRAGGLHLYANYPWLQIGPMAFALAELIRHLARTRAWWRHS